jgi:hypothetical protein
MHVTLIWYQSYGVVNKLNLAQVKTQKTLKNKIKDRIKKLDMNFKQNSGGVLPGVQSIWQARR